MNNNTQAREELLLNIFDRDLSWWETLISDHVKSIT